MTGIAAKRGGATACPAGGVGATSGAAPRCIRSCASLSTPTRTQRARWKPRRKQRPRFAPKTGAGDSRAPGTCHERMTSREHQEMRLEVGNRLVELDRNAARPQAFRIVVVVPCPDDLPGNHP